MINFKMTTQENFASFADTELGIMVFVDSFDNVNFDVRLGCLTESHFVATIEATDDETLNSKLNELYLLNMQQNEMSAQE